MSPLADNILRQCERHIGIGDFDNARKLARSLSVIAGNAAWERAYAAVIDGENPMQHVQTRTVGIPLSLAPYLHSLHDEGGKELPNQSVRGGTQVNITHDADVQAWLHSLGKSDFAGIWSTRLATGGFHIPHIHPRGHFSHVIYIEVPEHISGQLYFGVPRYVAMPRRHRILAERGLMVSFPNWLWHGVTEYRGAQPRLAVAFDTNG